jgi:predicted nucleic acid-binding protein
VSFVVLDTDVASGSFRGTLPGRLQARLASSTGCITFVTLGELTKWTAIRSWDRSGWRSSRNGGIG